MNVNLVVEPAFFFLQKIGRSGQSECNTTPGRNSSWVDPVPVKDGRLYRYTEFYAYHGYWNFADKLLHKQPKWINLAMIETMLMQNGDMIKKPWILLYTCSTDRMTKKWIVLKT